MADINKLLESLSPEKRRLLELKLKKQQQHPKEGPLSYSQQRLWFLDQLEPGSTAYNLPAAVRMRGKLDTDRLHKSISSIIKRHEILRTTFHAVNGKPVQRVAPKVEFKIEIQDLSTQKDPESAAWEFMRSDNNLPFDLQTGPLLRVFLLQLEPSGHWILYLNMHHIISDGWSVGVFVRELSTFYGQTQANMPALEIQYLDFARWQLKTLQGETREKQLAYWREKITSHPPILELPTDAPRPAVKSYRGKNAFYVTRQVDLTALRDLAAAEGSTMFMLLLAAFYTLLYRYTGQEDLCVGTPIANRNRAETQDLIGFFVNTLVMRQQFSGDESFRELLRQVRSTALEGFAHQDLPFEMLVEDLQPERDLSHTPLFQVMFVYQPLSGALMELPDLQLESLGIQSDSAKFDITFNLNEQPNALRLNMEFDSDLFEQQTVDRMLRHFEILLQSIASEPDIPIATLSYIPAKELDNLTNNWPGAGKSFFVEKCLHQIFEERVLQFPQRIAISLDDQQLTYRELNAQANQLAHFLIEQGLQPDQLVGVYMERTPQLIIALLAIQKAGAAYLPMDPVYPAERIEFMLNDGQAKLVLTQQSLTDNLPDSLPRFVIDEQWAQVAGASEENPLSPVTPQNLSYVIYTSGSTGKPKGTLITHQNVVRLFTATEAWFHFDESDVWTLFHSYAFDFSVWEIWGALLYGGRLVIVPQMTSRLPQDFYDLLAREGVTVLNQTPSAFYQLIQSEAGRDDLPELALRLVIFGGEALDLMQLKPWYKKHPVNRPQLINMYGITETTVHVTYHPITLNDVESNRGSVIGKAIPDLKVYILDQHLQPVGTGIKGEICVSGAGLARGYLNRPQLSSERFIVNPFASQAGERLYLSGDLARWQADGSLEYLGRKDSQIKIRGFRIELGEIETVLANHPRVRQAHVLTTKDKWENDQIIAFFVKEGAEPVSIADIRSHMQNKIPDYMVPAAFVELEEFPLTANGKIDRRALVVPHDLDATPQAEYVAPRNTDEELISAVFGEILDRSRIGVLDNFFEIGGHSLLATQVISRINEELKIDLPLREIFQNPTVEQLATVATDSRRSANGISSPPIEVVSRDQRIPLSFAQQRLWFLDQLEPNSAFYNIPGAYRIKGPLNVEVLEQSLQQMIERHEILRTVFRSADGKAWQHIQPRLALILPHTDLSTQMQDQRESTLKRMLEEEAGKPFNLSSGPLFRAHLVHMQTDDHVLLLTMHHIISDAWSMRVFIREVAQIYRGLLKDRNFTLPQPPLQYADFANWQRTWLQGEVLDKQIAYWRSQLEGAPTTLELSISKTRPAVQTYNGDHYYFDIPDALVSALQNYSKSQAATLFMTTLTAFNVLLSRYSGQEDILIGSPIANRNRRAVEDIIGFFVNTLVLRTDLSGNPSFSQLLARVKDTALGAYSHQDLPFEKLMDALNIERNLSHPPLFQVMFMLQTATTDLPPDEALNISYLESDHKISQFDLTMTLVEKQDKMLGSVEYNTDLFDAEAIRQLASHFVLVVQQMVERPEQKIATVSLLTPSAKEQVARFWQGPHQDLPQDSGIHQLFERQAEQTPEAIAVIDGTHQYNYKQLSIDSSNLANRLQTLGIGNGDFVGISIERSYHMLVGMLGILKSGAAYLPLDPNYPSERLHFMVQDSKLTTIVTTQALSASLPDTPKKHVLVDENSENQPDPSKGVNPHASFNSLSTAYVIYTSGSTGTPKGVQVGHQSVINHNYAVIKDFDLKAEDRMLQFATINFDSAVEEIFPTLLSGGCLVLRGPDVLISGGQLLDLIEQYAITVIDLPTAYWHQIVSELENSERSIPPGLRLVVLGGDKINPEKFMVWNKLAGAQIRLINTYGPTETTIISTAYEITDQDRKMQLASDLPIGRPIANTRSYVLDAQLQPVPVGVPGELVTGGLCLAHGYLNRPDLTAEKFVPDPFSEVPGARMYRTGDLVCFRADGQINFLGRIDQQVKIRGFRVEIGEIETVLNQHELVQNAIVVTKDDGSGKRLIAYYVAPQAPQTLAADLREWTQERLPDYMVPAAFVAIDEIPYTPAGKIATARLPEPQDMRAQIKSEYVAPRSENEQILTEIMLEVLGQNKIGIRDNFFELGGDSILSIQVIARANQRGLQVTPVQMFKYQTIEKLAAVVKSGPQVEAEQGLVSGSAPLTPIQHWFFGQNFAHPEHWNQSLLFGVREKLDAQLLETVSKHLLEHHDALRLRFKSSGRQDNSPIPEHDIFSYFDGSQIEPEGEKAFVESRAQEIQQSLNLQDGPLMRLAYFDFASRPGRLLLVIHHLAVDGVSWRILLEDFQTAYHQLLSGQEIALPRKTTAFIDWAAKLQEMAASGVFDEELPFWQKMASQSKIQLQAEKQVGPNSEASQQLVSIELDKDQTTALLQEVPPVYNTQINDILLAAIVLGYARWNGQRNLLIHLEGHGREEIGSEVDISRTVGWFTTLFPVLLNLGDAVEPGAIIKTIKEQLRAIPKKGIGFGILRYMHPQQAIRQQLSVLDNTAITFNYLGQLDQAMQTQSMFGPAAESRGQEHFSGEKRSALIDVTAAVGSGKLKISFSFSINQFFPQSVQEFAQASQQALQELITHCKSPQAGGHTASDFELAKLDDKKLDKVMAQLQKGKKRRRRK